MTQQTIQAEPYEFAFNPKSTALVMIDMQRDFVEPGGLRRGAGQRRLTAAGGDRSVQAHARRGTRDGHDGDPHA